MLRGGSWGTSTFGNLNFCRTRGGIGEEFSQSYFNFYSHINKSHLFILFMLPINIQFYPPAKKNSSAKMWTCCFCSYRQSLPQYYADHITEAQLPQEKTSPTIEYLLPNTSCLPPLFLFVLDTSINNAEDELEFLKAKEKSR